MKLDDKFRLERGRAYLTGIQALVRLPMDQMRRDRRSGLNTAAFISGYEGSPLGGYDLALARVSPLLDEHHIHFVPGSERRPGRHFHLRQPDRSCVWASRSTTAWSASGTAKGRAWTAPATSSAMPICRAPAAIAPRSCWAATTMSRKAPRIPHQSDLSFYNFGMPVFYPGNTQEILDYGLLAIALSRFSGAWVADEDGDQRLRWRLRPSISIPSGPRLRFPRAMKSGPMRG